MLDINGIKTRMNYSGYASINLLACINQNQMNRLTDVLIGVKHIDYFQIGHNNLGNSVIDTILKLLPDTKITWLNIASNNICSYQLNKTDANNICQNIKILYLDNNDLSGEFIGRLCESLDEQSILEELYIKNTNINESDIINISTMININKNIKLLDLSRNNIGKYLSHLSTSLTTNSTLTTLILSDTKITYCHVCNLFDALANSLSMIRILELENNNLGSDSANYIAESLRSQNYNIKQLSLYGNNFKSADLKLFKLAVVKYSFFIIYLHSNTKKDIFNILK